MKAKDFLPTPESLGRMYLCTVDPGFSKPKRGQQARIEYLLYRCILIDHGNAELSILVSGSQIQVLPSWPLKEVEFLDLSFSTHMVGSEEYIRARASGVREVHHHS